MPTLDPASRRPAVVLSSDRSKNSIGLLCRCCFQTRMAVNSP